jgi:DNA uptake protein ComE-like DNA-binding protein
MKPLMNPATFSDDSRRRRADAGSVLIVVLWACLGLVSMVLVFNHSMLMTYRGADNDLAGRQAEQALEGASRYAQVVVTNSNTTSPGLFPNQTAAAYQTENIAVGDATYWFIGRSWDVSANMVGTTRAYGLVDEASKLNINSSTVTQAMLMLLPNMTEDFAAAIIDWRTPAGTSTATASGGVNYNAKHAPFESIEELLLVSGATRELLYGQDINLNGIEDDGDGQQSTGGSFTPGILEYVTAFTREPKKRSDGTDRVNVRQPNAQLRTQLTTSLGQAGRANQIMAAFPPNTTLTGGVLEFYVRSGMTADEFAKVSDALTAFDPAVATGDYVPGLVNVNTASETVLACIPGIGADKAASIIAARAGRSATADTSIAWVGDLLGRDGARQAGAFLTGRSYQVSADVAAVGRRGRGYRRERFVVDYSTGTPRIVYRRNLTPLGWALGSDVRQTLANNAAKGGQ